MKKKKSLTGVFAVLALVALCSAHVHRQKQAAPDAPAVHLSAQAAEKQTAADTDAAPTPRGLEIPGYESPRGGQVIRHTGFTLSYDADFKTPQWVGWVLTRSRAEGSVPRADDFRRDPKVRGKQAVTKDYSGSGYDRGHIAPAGDMKWSEAAMNESFYLSNVCPQNKNLNRGDWKDLEELEREWARRYGVVVITAGPVYATKRPERIGANRVGVPTGFFKALLRGEGAKRKAYAFYFDNAAGSRSLTHYQMTVDALEAKTGIDFFPALADDEEARLEARLERL